MTINASRFYSSIFVLVLLLQLYLPSFEINILIQMAVLSMCVVLEKIIFSISVFKDIVLLIGILLTGFIGTMIFKYETYDILRDIAHFFKPVIGLLIGYFFYKTV